MPDSESLPRSRVLLFAVACGLAVANVYYAHPLLDAIADSFGIAPASVGVVVTVTQIGYGLGLLLLVPLGDVLDRRRLIVTQLLVSVAALAVVGAARSPALLLLGMAAVGLLAVVAQVLVAFAATLARADERGQIVGAVTSGIVIGILLARTFAGLVAQLGSWRSVYLASAALTLALAAALLRGLPADDRRDSRPAYRTLLRSTLALYLSAPALRVRGTLAMLIFATFSVLWASLALELGEPPLSLSHAAIGAFGLAGAAGALARDAGGPARRPRARPAHHGGGARADARRVASARAPGAIAARARRRPAPARLRRPGRPRHEPEHPLRLRPGGAQPTRGRLHGLLLRRQRRRLDRVDRRPRLGGLDGRLRARRRDQRGRTRVLGGG